MYYVVNDKVIVDNLISYYRIEGRDAAILLLLSLTMKYTGLISQSRTSQLKTKRNRQQANQEKAAKQNRSLQKVQESFIIRVDVRIYFL